MSSPILCASTSAAISRLEKSACSPLRASATSAATSLEPSPRSASAAAASSRRLGHSTPRQIARAISGSDPSQAEVSRLNASSKARAHGQLPLERLAHEQAQRLARGRLEGAAGDETSADRHLEQDLPAQRAPRRARGARLGLVARAGDRLGAHLHAVLGEDRERGRARLDGEPQRLRERGERGGLRRGAAAENRRDQ